MTKIYYNKDGTMKTVLPDGAAVVVGRADQQVKIRGQIGEAPAPIAQYRGRHRHHLLLKLPTRACAGALAALRAVRGELRSLAPTIDVDPVSML